MGVRADNHERRARRELAGRPALNQIHMCADLPSSWRSIVIHKKNALSLTAQVSRIHLSSARLQSSDMTLDSPVDTALPRAMATSELGQIKALSCLSAVAPTASFSARRLHVDPLHIQSSLFGYVSMWLGVGR